ncbi:MAG: DUF420 domain-containing protein [Aquincola sp.]|nr:DUF420 domain-containing protein [Aquincola sp.]
MPALCNKSPPEIDSVSKGRPRCCAIARAFGVSSSASPTKPAPKQRTERLVSRAARARFDLHKKIARWTWPVWMYVSVTGVLIYFLLYHDFPSR